MLLENVLALLSKKPSCRKLLAYVLKDCLPEWTFSKILCFSFQHTSNFEPVRLLIERVA